MSKSLNVGDLVWAKMKGYPPWPGEISQPPASVKQPKSKKSQYVYFFGSDNCAWIPVTNILEHSEKLVKENRSKKKTPAFQKAIEIIIKKSMGVISSDAETEKAASPKHKEDSEEIPKTSSSDPEQENPKIVTKAAIYEEIYKNLLDDLPDFPVDTSPPPSPQSPQSPQPTVDIEVERPETPPFDLSKENPVLLEKNIIPTSKKIGFLGLGLLGQGIVKNLHQSGHSVTIWNRTKGKCKPFADTLNIKVASTPKQVVLNSDIIFCCVSDAFVAKDLVFGCNGVLSGLQKCSSELKKGYVLMTSMDADAAQEIATKIALLGCRYLEAPLKGTRMDAFNGTLFIQTSGDKSLYDDCESCFKAISKMHTYCGCDIGYANKMHALYSMFVGAFHCGLAESMSLTADVTLKQKDLLGIYDSTVLQNEKLVKIGKSMLDGNYTCNARLKHVHKDLKYGLELASSVDTPTPIMAATNEVLKRCKSMNLGDLDICAVYETSKS